MPSANRRSRHPGQSERATAQNDSVRCGNRRGEARIESLDPAGSGHTKQQGLTGPELQRQLKRRSAAPEVELQVSASSLGLC